MHQRQVFNHKKPIINHPLNIIKHSINDKTINHITNLYLKQIKKHANTNQNIVESYHKYYEQYLNERIRT